jgi:hypothetical protein
MLVAAAVLQVAMSPEFVINGKGIAIFLQLLIDNLPVHVCVVDFPAEKIELQRALEGAALVAASEVLKDLFFCGPQPPWLHNSELWV